jgi:hypothetical protein
LRKFGAVTVSDGQKPDISNMRKKMLCRILVIKIFGAFADCLAKWQSAKNLTLKGPIPP